MTHKNSLYKAARMQYINADKVPNVTSNDFNATVGVRLYIFYTLTLSVTICAYKRHFTGCTCVYRCTVSRRYYDRLLVV